MKVFTQILPEQIDVSVKAVETVTLSYEIRQKARFKAMADTGEEIGVQVERGNILRDGTLLGNDDEMIQVLAAPESLSRVSANDPTLFARLCYHLGNRHVPLQIDEYGCSYQHDHVLDDMIKGLGGNVAHVQDKFEPEAGAYSNENGESHSHGHSSHTHSHSHSH